MSGAQDMNDRPFRHDRTIMINATRAIFAGWYDRLVLAAVLVAALATLRFWILDRPWNAAAWLACGVAVVLGISAERLIAARLSYHGFDGILAADALRPATRRRFTAAWHGVSIALLVTVTLIARSSLLVVAIPAYLAGGLGARLTSAVRMPIIGRRGSRVGWTVRMWLHSPIAGVAAAAILLVSLLPTHALGAEAVMAIAGIGTVLLGIALTPVDDRVVGFMAIAGHGSRDIVARHGKGAATFVVLAVPIGWLTFGPGVAAIIAVLSAGLLVLLILRVLAYRLHAKRIADVLVAIVAGLVILVTYAVPVALPFVAVVAVWHLHRRGRAKTWLLT